jgi:hypothetical protein
MAAERMSGVGFAGLSPYLVARGGAASVEADEADAVSGKNRNLHDRLVVRGRNLSSVHRSPAFKESMCKAAPRPRKPPQKWGAI